MSNPSPRILLRHVAIDDGKLEGEETSTRHPLEELEAFDVVITTYTVMRKQHETMRRTYTAWKEWLKVRLPWNRPERGPHPLYVISWWFVILDEAHTISHPTTKVAYAACDLDNQFRVPVTGTPLQNEYTDVQGLLRFMHVHPWFDLRFFKKVRINIRSETYSIH